MPWLVDRRVLIWQSKASVLITTRPIWLVTSKKEGQAVALRVLERVCRNTSRIARILRSLFGDGGKSNLSNLSSFETCYRCESETNAFDNSQGAQCAHKALGELDSAVANVIALGVFGDPISVWQDSVDYPAIPEDITLLSYCEKTTPDPLCTDPMEDFPQNPKAFIDRLKTIWEEVDTTHMNDAQKAAVGELLVELPKQAIKELGQLATDISQGHLRRWMLSPQHFWYGIDGKVKTAVDDLLRVYNSQK